LIVAVFFPSLMGVGIIVSGALLVSDWIRRLLPHSSLHRQHDVVVGTYGAITDAIAAAGYRLAEPRFLHRELRRRRAYLGLAVVLVVGAVAAVRGGLAFYNDAKGVFFRNPWPVGIGYGVAGAALVLAVLLLVIAISYRRLPRALQPLVERTMLGRYVLPSGTDQAAALRNIERRQ
jgi:hypothetical protein